MKELKKIEYRILEIMKLGTVKSEALVTLKKEYNLVCLTTLNNIWLDVKENKEKYEGEKKKADRKEKNKMRKKSEVGVNPQVRVNQSAKIESSTIAGEKSVEIKVESKPKLKIKKAEIEGEYGEYIISDDGVRLGDQLFKTPDDIEKYRLKELEDFYAQLREINEVMAMI